MDTNADAVVVVGASSGGAQALSQLLHDLPKEIGAAILVVLHMSTHEESQLPIILQRATCLPVHEAEDGMTMLTGHVYVAVPDRHLLATDDGLRLTRGPRESRSRPSVDALFRSAAAVFGNRVVGVVLSGMLDDGTAGLWAIKDRGGVALAQSDSDGVHASMPTSAQAHVALDGFFPVNDLGRAVSIAVDQLTVRSPESAGVPRDMEIEIRIALEANGLEAGVMTLGKVSQYTCPECQGVLVEIKDGSLIRFRCHTGHAASMKTLLLDVDDAIDRGLSSALRGVEERILLLQQMAQIAIDAGSPRVAEGYLLQARQTDARGAPLRALVADPILLEHRA